LQPIAWMVVAVGVALLALNHFTKAKPSDATSEPPTSTPTASVPKPQPVAVVEAQKKQAPPPAIPPTRNAPNAWCAGVFADIEWRRFEAVCEALFAQAGFQTKSQSHGADGGVDIWLFSRHADGPAAIVQCKHWYDKPVGVKELREFFGVMSSHKLARGTYATTSLFTSEAQRFAEANGINTLDGKRLLDLIISRTPEQQKALLAIAHEGEYWRPTCASCGIKLVERVSSKGGAPFWGCSNYPRCRMQVVKRNTGAMR
jgi:restriction system protein